jgi:hypothetical protein
LLCCDQQEKNTMSLLVATIIITGRQNPTGNRHK